METVNRILAEFNSQSKTPITDELFADDDTIQLTDEDILGE